MIIMIKYYYQSGDFMLDVVMHIPGQHQCRPLSAMHGPLLGFLQLVLQLNLVPKRFHEVVLEQFKQPIHLLHNVVTVHQ